MEAFCTSARTNSLFFSRLIDSGVSEECSCCRTISRTVPANSGRSFLFATNFSLTKLTDTEPPETANRKAPSELSPIGLPRAFTTSSRRDLNGSIPFHEAALVFLAKLAQIKIIRIRTVVARREQIGWFLIRSMARMLIQGQVFAKGRTRSADSFKSG